MHSYRNVDYVLQTNLVPIGLTQTDAVRGAQTKWNELYEQYYEIHFVTGNKEMRRLRKSYNGSHEPTDYAD